MRLFIALPLPSDTRRALSEIQRRLGALVTGGRYVPAANFHITLHFIGESSNLAGAAHACTEAARGIRPFLLNLDTYGSFPKGETQTGYVSLAGNLNELYSLHESLVAHLGEEGFARSGSRKRLTPHITLARDLPPFAPTPEALASLTDRLGGGSAFTVNQLVLYQSENIHGGMRYTPLHKVHLR